MHIECIPINQLQPAPYNPRKTLKPGMPGYTKLQRSLREFDLVQPIVWNRTTGHIVGGHQRVQILRDEGVAEVECVVVELSLEREKALNVALNNSRVGSDWDAEKLIDLVSELQDLPDIDVTLTGFDAADLTHLLLTPAPPSHVENGDEDGQHNLVTVTLEIPLTDWQTLRPRLDECLVEHPQVRLHVRPTG